MDVVILPIAALAQYFFGGMMFLTSLFLILLVLVQRGRGGGLAGAFGGMGGQSAFGTKAGDLFTKLTMGVATFWILLCVLAISVLNRPASPLGGDGSSVFDDLESGAPSISAPGPTDPPTAEAVSGESAGLTPAETSAGSAVGGSPAGESSAGEPAAVESEGGTATAGEEP